MSPLVSFMACALGYLLGSIPFGLIITRFAGTADIRSIGSGNIGATNVLRTGRKGLAALTLVCDALKGTAAALLAWRLWGHDAALVAAAGAFLGHLYPVWLKFRGGKGVATYLGLLIALAWPGALAFAAVWLVTAAITRYSSLAALLGSLAATLAVWFAGYEPEARLFGMLTALLWLMHRANILRLMGGVEGKIGGDKTSDAPPAGRSTVG
jgi:glycerol-3-phosphate acyltransferase PlsY